MYLDPDIVEMFGDIANEYVRRFRKMVLNTTTYFKSKTIAWSNMELQIW